MSWPWVVVIVVNSVLVVIALLWLIGLSEGYLTLKEESKSADDRQGRELERLKTANWNLSDQVNNLIPLITSEVDEETDEAVATLKVIAAELES